MFKSVLFVLLPAFLLWTTSSGVGPNECFPVKPMPGLTTYTFYHLDWHEINRTGTDLDEGTFCGTFLFDHAPAKPGDPELVAFEHRYNETDRKHDFVVFGNATVEGDSYKLEIQYPVDSVKSKYYVIDTDYDWYAVVYSCAPQSTIKERMWILSRRDFMRANATIAAEELKHAMQAVSDQGPEFAARASQLLKPCPRPSV